MTDIALARLPDNQAKADGLAVGKAVAEKIVALRSADNFAATATYSPESGAGKWQPTPPTLLPALGGHWGTVKPFLIKNVDEFQVDPPPPLASAEYAKQVNEVKDLGGKQSRSRSADQTEAAVFWTALAAPLWNQVARQAAQQNKTGIVENARLFAMLNMAGTDAFIPCWQMKYKYNFWRPVHAIRNADSAGNNAVSAEPAWEPLIITPPFPEYVSGHTAYAGAAEKILQTYVGTDRMSFTVSNPAVGITRRFESFSQLAREVNNARVWGGVHYRISDEHGLELGRKVADYSLKNFLLPVARQASEEVTR